MSNSPYYQLDKLIDEYEEDSNVIKSDKLIMVNYPKVFVMTAASTFERQIKNRCHEFITHPVLPLASYPNIQSLLNYSIRKSIPITDLCYNKFHTYDRNTSVINLDANDFYVLFGGVLFKNSVEHYFMVELTNRLAYYQNIVNELLPLVESKEEYIADYVINDDIRERLTKCNFSLAEKAFLELKLRRNNVAHDYINGLSDTFEDIRDFYLDAVVYVSGVERAIENLTL